MRPEIQDIADAPARILGADIRARLEGLFQAVFAAEGDTDLAGREMPGQHAVEGQRRRVCDSWVRVELRMPVFSGLRPGLTNRLAALLTFL